MVRIIENSSTAPICPHCEKEIRDVHAQRIQSTFGVRYLYYCGECKKTLGISHRKGFWMG